MLPNIDLVVTDPPYEIQAYGQGGINENRDWLKNVHNDGIDTYNPIPFLNRLRQVMHPLNAYIFTSKNLLDVYIRWAKKHGYNWDILVMAKRNPVPTKHNKYLPDTEFIFYVRQKGACFNNDHEYDMYRKVKPVSVTSNDHHPAEKPVELLKELIQISSEEGDLVFDPYAGSGSTCVAAKELNRHYLGVEISKKHYKTAVQQLQSVEPQVIPSETA